MRKSTETDRGLERLARIRSWMAMTLKRFLYFSMSFSKVMSLALDATYSAEVVLQRRWTVTAAEEQEVGGLELSFLRMRIAIV